MPEKYSESQKKLTQESIKTAFYQLMVKYPVQAINVTMIAERAGVSRMAVYRHFENKEAIASSFLDDVVTSMMKKIYPVIANNPYNATLRFFQAVKENKEAFEIIVQSELESQFFNKFSFYVDQYLSESMADVPVEEDYLVYRNRFLTAGLYYTSIEWIKRGMKEPIERLARIPSAMAVEVEGDFYFRPGYPLEERKW